MQIEALGNSSLKSVNNWEKLTWKATRSFVLNGSKDSPLLEINGVQIEKEDDLEKLWVDTEFNFCVLSWKGGKKEIMKDDKMSDMIRKIMMACRSQGNDEFDPLAQTC